MLGLKSGKSVSHSGKGWFPAYLSLLFFWGKLSSIYSNEGYQSSPFSLAIRMGKKPKLALSGSFFIFLKIGSKGVQIPAPLVANVHSRLQVAIILALCVDHKPNTSGEAEKWSNESFEGIPISFQSCGGKVPFKQFGHVNQKKKCLRFLELVTMACDQNYTIQQAMSQVDLCLRKLTFATMLQVQAWRQKEYSWTISVTQVNID